MTNKMSILLAIWSIVAPLIVMWQFGPVAGILAITASTAAFSAGKATMTNYDEL